jgi:Uma2 family endonuclease
MPVTERTFEQLALEDPEGHWELSCGRLRRKPGMTYAHNDIMTELGFALRNQLPPDKFRVRINAGHLSLPAASYYIPDVMVIPVPLTEPLRDRVVLETYSTPLPLVVEVWSPSTGEYDADAKIPEYRRRGDLEIWRIHPYDHTLIAWRRQPDGSYTETTYTSGAVQPASLPGITIDLSTLW